VPLLPDKPNPPVHSIAQPDAMTRRCTKCLVRKIHDEFRWLWVGIRKSSACKDCESKQRRARRQTDGKLIKAPDRFGMPNINTSIARMEDQNGSVKNPAGSR
jgi:hypothetical protein